MCSLHNQKSIVHSVKAANILLSADRKTAKIADFGLSKIRLQGEYASSALSAGTINYLPPERVNTQAVADRSADVYAMGALLWEMVTCSVMWHGMSMQDIALALLNNNRPAIPAHADADVALLIQEYWTTDAAARPTALDLWRRVSVLDINNPDFNKALEPYSLTFSPTCFTLEQCLRKALQPATCDVLLLDLHLVNCKYNEQPLQAIVQQRGLTELEAKCIIMHTMESRRVSKAQQLYTLFCQAYRQRNEEAIDAFADFSFHFWNGLSKLPDHAVPVYRGLDKRLADMNDLYYEGNVVYWHYPSSCTSDKAVASRFSNGGTLLSLANVTKAKSIAAFSLIKTEREFLIDFTSEFDVRITLTSEKSKSLKEFSDLPDNVDLVVLSARAPVLPPAVPSISFGGASSSPLAVTSLPALPLSLAHASIPQPAVFTAATPVSYVPSAPLLNPTSSQPFAAAALTASYPHLPVLRPYASDNASSASNLQQNASLAPLHLPDLTRPYIHPAAGVELRVAHAYLPAPAVALSFVSCAAAADQQATVTTPIPLRDGPFQNRALPPAIAGHAALEQV